MSSDRIREQFDRAAQRHLHLQLGGPNPSEKLAQIVAAADVADPDDLGWIGIELIEALLDTYGDEIADEVEEALRTHTQFAIAYGWAAIQSDELSERFEPLIPPDDDANGNDEDTDPLVGSVREIDTATLLDVDASQMRRRRRRSLGPDWVHGHIVTDRSHLISPVGIESDEPGEAGELSCLVAVAMDDGICRAVLISVLRTVFDGLPEPLSEEDQRSARAAIEALDSLGLWISDRIPKTFGRH